MADRAKDLREQIAVTEERLQDLKLQLERAERDCRPEGQECATDGSSTHCKLNGARGSDKESAAGWPCSGTWPLTNEEYRRYGRQMILPEIGLQGQLRLRNAKVLIVGVGGLGCPAAAYLAGAGVGTLGLVDGDTVETSNLHRQTAHSSSRMGVNKVDSACEYLRSYVTQAKKRSSFLPRQRSLFGPSHLLSRRLNPRVSYHRHRFHLSPETALSLFDQYDVVLDCTDHPTSRYLISDACVLAGRLLISAAALKTEGQLMVLNSPPAPPGEDSGGPCYRCIFPKPPPAASIVSCGEGGILGPVVGVMGVLQALEAIKAVVKSKRSDLQSSEHATKPEQPTLLMFAAYDHPQFRSVRLRSRRSDCAVCSDQASVTRQSLENGSTNYVAFCGTSTPASLASAAQISPSEFVKLQQKETLIIDVRDETQYGICSLPNSMNIPWTGHTESWLRHARDCGVLRPDGRALFTLCRYGNDSQLAAKAILERAPSFAQVKSIAGGLASWRREVDPQWPEY